MACTAYHYLVVKAKIIQHAGDSVGMVLRMSLTTQSWLLLKLVFPPFLKAQLG